MYITNNFGIISSIINSLFPIRFVVVDDDDDSGVGIESCIGSSSLHRYFLVDSMGRFARQNLDVDSSVAGMMTHTMNINSTRSLCFAFLGLIDSCHDYYD